MIVKIGPAGITTLCQIQYDQRFFRFSCRRLEVPGPPSRAGRRTGSAPVQLRGIPVWRRAQKVDHLYRLQQILVIVILYLPLECSGD